MLRRDTRPGLRRELLVVDYVLPLSSRRRKHVEGSVATRSPFARGTLYFGRTSFAVDRIAYFGIFLEGWYETNFRDAVVVDVGAHKGYFGAYALLEGAREVRSFEPEARNFALLQRSSVSFDKPWIVKKAAVGSAAGRGCLHVSAESAGHSMLHKETSGKRQSVGSEQVELVPMRDVLVDAKATGSRLIVKVDAEGAECEIVLGTPVEIWREVDQVFLEVHDFAPCSTADIVQHLEAAGLELRRQITDSEADLLSLERVAQAPCVEALSAQDSVGRV